MFKKILSLTVIVSFFLTTLGPYPQAHADTVLGLPAPGTMVNLSPAYEPVIIKGLTVHKDNPFLFDFIVDVGQDRMSGEPLKKEGEKLIKYFLASLAIPDKDVWVNLSPYEKNKMIPEALGQTDMGRDLLEQDYILKQITASLIDPEKQLGKTFWDKVYAKAQEMYGTTQVPVNTFNKVWIMADRAEVFEHNQTAFVVDNHLKVMLEEDYLALQKHSSPLVGENNYSPPLVGGVRGGGSDPHAIASQIVRAIILPELEKEVNTGKNFANLRQIFNSILLSSWYKRNLKEALLNQVYANKSKVKGINLNDATVKQQIYEQYLKAYKKGVFNYIKEDINTANGETIPRKYFSGGLEEGADAENAFKETTDPRVLDAAMGSEGIDRLVKLQTGFVSGNTNGFKETDAAISTALEGAKALLRIVKDRAMTAEEIADFKSDLLRLSLDQLFQKWNLKNVFTGNQIINVAFDPNKFLFNLSTGAQISIEEARRLMDPVKSALFDGPGFALFFPNMDEVILTRGEKLLNLIVTEANARMERLKIDREISITDAGKTRALNQRWLDAFGREQNAVHKRRALTHDRAMLSESGQFIFEGAELTPLQREAMVENARQRGYKAIPPQRLTEQLNNWAEDTGELMDLKPKVIKVIRQNAPVLANQIDHLMEFLRSPPENGQIQINGQTYTLNIFVHPTFKLLEAGPQGPKLASFTVKDTEAKTLNIYASRLNDIVYELLKQVIFKDHATELAEINANSPEAQGFLAFMAQAIVRQEVYTGSDVPVVIPRKLLDEAPGMTIDQLQSLISDLDLLKPKIDGLFKGKENNYAKSFIDVLSARLQLLLLQRQEKAREKAFRDAEETKKRDLLGELTKLRKNMSEVRLTLDGYRDGGLRKVESFPPNESFKTTYGTSRTFVPQMQAFGLAWGDDRVSNRPLYKGVVARDFLTPIGIHARHFMDPNFNVYDLGVRSVIFMIINYTVSLPKVRFAEAARRHLDKLNDDQISRAANAKTADERLDILKEAYGDIVSIAKAMGPEVLGDVRRLFVYSSTLIEGQEPLSTRMQHELIAFGLNEGTPSKSGNAVCAGFGPATEEATTLLRDGKKGSVLVIMPEKYSDILDMNNRTSGGLFGDVAVAYKLGQPDPQITVNGLDLRTFPGASVTYGQLSGFITATHFDDRRGRFDMLRNTVLQFVNQVPVIVEEYLDRHGLTLEQIDYMVTHQPQRGGVMSLAKAFGIGTIVTITLDGQAIEEDTGYGKPGIKTKIIWVGQELANGGGAATPSALRMLLSARYKDGDRKGQLLINPLQQTSFLTAAFGGGAQIAVNLVVAKPPGEDWNPRLEEVNKAKNGETIDPINSEGKINTGALALRMGMTPDRTYASPLPQQTYYHKLLELLREFGQDINRVLPEAQALPMDEVLVLGAGQQGGPRIAELAQMKQVKKIYIYTRNKSSFDEMLNQIEKDYGPELRKYIDGIVIWVQSADPEHPEDADYHLKELLQKNKAINLAFEILTEDKDIKEGRIEAIWKVRPEVSIISNSSSLSIVEMAKSVAQKIGLNTEEQLTHVLLMHDHTPFTNMFMEISDPRKRKIDERLYASAREFANQIGHVSVLADDTKPMAQVGNMAWFGGEFLAALNLWSRGYSPEVIRRAAATNQEPLLSPDLQLELPYLGADPFETAAVLVGVEVTDDILRNMATSLGLKLDERTMRAWKMYLERRKGEGRRGIYESRVNPESGKIVLLHREKDGSLVPATPAKPPSLTKAAQEVTDRLRQENDTPSTAEILNNPEELAKIREELWLGRFAGAGRVLDMETLTHPRYIDTALSWFAMSTISGGVLKMIDRIGPRKVLRLLSAYKEKYGELFAPFQKLSAVAAKHTTFTQEYGEPKDIAPRHEKPVRTWEEMFRQWDGTPEITRVGNWAKGEVEGLGNWGPKDAEIPADKAMLAELLTGLPLYEKLPQAKTSPTTLNANFFFGVSNIINIGRSGQDNQLVLNFQDLAPYDTFGDGTMHRHFTLDVNFSDLDRMLIERKTEREEKERKNEGKIGRKIERKLEPMEELEAGLWALLQGKLQGQVKPEFKLHEIDPVAFAQWEDEQQEAPFKTLTGRKLLDTVLDAPNQFFEINGHLGTADPLRFSHSDPDTGLPLSYAKKIAAEETSKGEKSAVITGVGTIGGIHVAIASMDRYFFTGTLSPVEGEKIKRLVEFAGQNKLPLVIITASGGARMQQSAESLMQLPKISSMIEKYKKEGGHYVSVLMNPTTGGVSASFAFQSDYVMAEKGALIAFAGPNLVRQAMGLPKTHEFEPDFQRAERLKKLGFVNEIFTRRTLKDQLAAYLNKAVTNNIITGTNNWRKVRYVPTPNVPESLRHPPSSKLSPFQRLKLARDPKRPNLKDYIEYWKKQGAKFDERFEPVLPPPAGESEEENRKNMARWADSQAIVGGVLTMPNGTKVMLIGSYKGPKGKLAPGPYAYRRSRLMMRDAQVNNYPIVTLVDLPGALSSPQSEDDGISKELALNQMYMSTLTVPVLSVITGEGGSGGAIAIGMGNRVLMMENAFYSVISPEFAAQILYQKKLEALKNPELENKLIERVLPELTASLKIGAVDLLKSGIVDGIIPEPARGAQADPKQAANNLLKAISETLPIFDGMSAQDIRESRLTRYSNMGSTAVSGWEGLKTETIYFLDHLELTQDEENAVSRWMDKNRKRLEDSRPGRFNLRQIRSFGKIQQNYYIDVLREGDRFIVTRTIDNNGASEIQSHVIYLREGAFEATSSARGEDNGLGIGKANGPEVRDMRRNVDKAMATRPGGIDLNTTNGMQWKVSKDGNGVEMSIDPAMIERVRREGIDSLSPVIFRITPVASIWPLVGLQAPAQAEHLAGV